MPNPSNATYHQRGAPGQPGNCECPPESVVCCREVCTWDVTQARKMNFLLFTYARYMHAESKPHACSASRGHKDRRLE